MIDEKQELLLEKLRDLLISKKEKVTDIEDKRKVSILRIFFLSDTNPFKGLRYELCKEILNFLEVNENEIPEMYKELTKEEDNDIEVL